MPGPRRAARRLFAVAALASAALACSPRPPVDPIRPAATASSTSGSPNGEADTYGDPASFRIDKAALRAGGASPRFVAKLDASAFAYFRVLAHPFEERTCWAFRDLRWTLPMVAVHGDAHLEQFVVTRETYGLEDFDEAGYGPAIVDVVRFASSIALACRDAKFPCDAKKLIARWLSAYREAIDKPPARDTPPKVVERLRKKAPQARVAWLDWVDTQMTALPEGEEKATRKAFAAFRDLQRAVLPDRPAEFYDIVRVGELHMGIGSALERKLLFRIRGATDDPQDDYVLEARSGDAGHRPTPVWRPQHGSSLHVLMFASLLGSRMPDVLGFVSIDRAPGSRPFWVQSWDPGYVELSTSDLARAEDIEELAVDAARQLAGHFWTRFPPSIRPYQRYAQLQAFDLVRARAETLSLELADEMVREWERFRASP